VSQPRGAPALRALQEEPLLVVDYLRLQLTRLYRKAPLGRSRHLDAPPLQRPVPWERGPEVIARAAGGWLEGDALGLARSASTAAAAARDGSRARRLARDLAGDRSLGELVYALVRATRPDAVIETGVAAGVTSAYVLAGLEDNGRGVLHSVDLPPPALVAGGLVGCCIPPSLRHRWRPRWGDARRLLPRVLGEARGSRIFIHDSDHGYAAMRRELECAWEAFGDGEWIVADDVELHRAFTDVAAGHGAHAFVIAQKDKRSCTGLMRHH
jgi:hypothetical protein